MPIADERDAHTNEMKKSRGDFIHGANWALKRLREASMNRNVTFVREGDASPYGIGNIVVRVPNTEQIDAGARERFPLSLEHDRILPLHLPGGVVKYGRVQSVRGKPEVRWFKDAEATQTVGPPPMNAEAVRIMADLLARPTETKTL